jgi:hypothetical protein
MKARILILIISLELSAGISAHPIHISVVNIDYISDSNLVKYSVRLFWDDFQTIVNKKYNTMLNFGKQSRMTSKEQESVRKYINTALIIKNSDNEVINPIFLGWKVEEMSVWLFFRASTKSTSDNFTIENRIMLEVFADQKNLLILRKADEEKGLEFNQRVTVQCIAI